MDVILALVLGVFIALYGVIFAYVRKLEDANCACSRVWQRSYVKWYLGLLIVYNTFLVVLALLGLHDPLASGIVGALMSLAIAVGGIVFVVAGLQYVNRIKDDQCKCSSGLGKDVLFYWALILGATVVLSAVNVGTHFLSSGPARSAKLASARKGRK